MLVLHVATRFAGGGSEQRIRDAVAAVPDAHHRIVVGELQDGHRHRCPVPLAQLEVDPYLLRAVSPAADARAVARMIRRLRSAPVDVVVTHQSKAGVIGRLAARYCGVPVVHSLSMASFGAGYGAVSSAVFCTVERLLAGGTAAYAVVGDDLARQYRRIGVAPERLRTIRSAVRLPAPPASKPDARARLSASAGLDPSRPVLAYVGSLEPRKQVLLLPAVLERVRSLLGTGVNLVVAGDGPLRERLGQEVRARHLDAEVGLLGHVDDVAPVFAGADAVVLPSRVEGLPQVLVQAAAAGVPFAAFDVSGARELVGLGASGVIAAPGDLDGLAVAITTLLRVPGASRAVDLGSWDPAVVRAGWADLLRPYARSAGADAVAA